MKLVTAICFVCVISLCLLENSAIDLTEGTSTVPTTEAAPQPAPEEERIFAAGIVEGADRTASLDFEFPGRLAEIAVSEGIKVHQGDILAWLDRGIAREQVAEAQAQLALARAEYDRIATGAREETLRVARAEADLAKTSLEHSANVWTRAQRLAQDNAISRDDLDTRGFLQKQSAAQVEVAQSRVREMEAPPRDVELKVALVKIQIAETAVARANVVLEKTVLRAPADGTILSIDGEIGELVGQDRSRPFLTMANLDTLHVRAFLEELDALAIEIGERAEVAADSRPDARYSGCVDWVSPWMTEKSLTHGKPGERHDVKVREVLIRLEEARDLVVGLPVEVFLTRKAAPAEASVTTSTSKDARSQPPNVSGPSETQQPRQPSEDLVDDWRDTQPGSETPPESAAKPFPSAF